MVQRKHFFFHFNRTTLLYFLILVLIPSSLYGIYQGSQNISFNHMKSVRDEVETDYLLKIPRSDFENLYKNLFNDILNNYSYNNNLKVIDFLAGDLIVDINDTRIDIYFCDWSKIKQIDRFQDKYSFFSQLDFEEFNLNNIIISQNLAEKQMWKQNNTVSFTGTSLRFNTSFSFDNYVVFQIIQQDSLFYGKSIYGNRDPSNKEFISYGSIFGPYSSSFTNPNFILIDYKTFSKNILPQIGFQQASEIIWLNLLYEEDLTIENYHNWKRDVKYIDEILYGYFFQYWRDGYYSDYFSPLEYDLSLISENLNVFQFSIFLSLIPFFIFGAFSLSSIGYSNMINEITNFRLLYIRGYKKEKILTKILSENMQLNFVCIPFIYFIGNFLKIIIIELFFKNDSDYHFSKIPLISSLQDGLIFFITLWGLNFAFSSLFLFSNFSKINGVFEPISINKDYVKEIIPNNSDFFSNLTKPRYLLIFFIFIIMIPLWFMIFKEKLGVLHNEISKIIEFFVVISLSLCPAAIVFLSNELFNGRILGYFIKLFDQSNNIKHFSRFLKIRKNKKQLLTLVLILSIINSHFVMSTILLSDSKLQIKKQAFDLIGGDYRLTPLSDIDIYEENPIINPNKHILDPNFSIFLQNHNFNFIKIYKSFDNVLYSFKSKIYSDNSSQFQFINSPLEVNSVNISKYLNLLYSHKSDINAYEELSELLPRLNVANSTIINSFFSEYFNINIGDLINIQRGNKTNLLEVVGIYSMNNLPGIIPISRKINIIVDSSSAFFDELIPMKDYSIDFILEDHNTQLRNKQQIMDLLKDNGYFIYEVQLWDKNEIIINLNTPIFRLALYPNLMKFIWSESILLIFIGFFSANFVIINLIKRNFDSLSLFTIRGFSNKKIRYFISRIFFSINVILFFSILVGLFNSFLIFQLLAKSEFMKGFHNQNDRFLINWVFLPIALLLNSLLVIILYKITNLKINRLNRDRLLIVSNLKEE